MRKVISAVKPSRIRQLREERGFSQDDLAARAALSQGAISLYESGDRTPSVAVLGKIARALGVTPSNLLEAATVDPEIDLIVEDLRHLPPQIRRAVRDFVARLRGIESTSAALVADPQPPYGRRRQSKLPSR